MFGFMTRKKVENEDLESKAISTVLLKVRMEKGKAWQELLSKDTPIARERWGNARNAEQFIEGLAR